MFVINIRVFVFLVQFFWIKNSSSSQYSDRPTKHRLPHSPSTRQTSQAPPSVYSLQSSRGLRGPRRRGLSSRCTGVPVCGVWRTDHRPVLPGCPGAAVARPLPAVQSVPDRARVWAHLLRARRTDLLPQWLSEVSPINLTIRGMWEA